jgi:hypothetical protein
MEQCANSQWHAYLSRIIQNASDSDLLQTINFFRMVGGGGGPSGQAWLSLIQMVEEK